MYMYRCLTKTGNIRPRLGRFKPIKRPGRLLQANKHPKPAIPLIHLPKLRTVEKPAECHFYRDEVSTIFVFLSPYILKKVSFFIADLANVVPCRNVWQFH